MTMSTQFKWLSFSIMSFAVISLLLMFLGFQARCDEDGHLRDRDTKECYEKNKLGPCQEGSRMVFQEEEPGSKIFGACGCPYMLFNRSVLYHGGKCHLIFSQADCPDGHWLNVTSKGEPICELNPCVQPELNGFEAAKNANDDGDVDNKSKDEINDGQHYRGNQTIRQPEYVPVKGGRCVKLNETDIGCPEGAVVRFHPGYILPSCHSPPTKFGESIGAIGVGPYTSCPLGSAKAITGICQPHFEFDFEEPSPKSKKN